MEIRPVRDVPKRLPKYVIEDKDRYGNVRVYLRRPGVTKVLLPGSPWSPEFMQAYAVALGTAPPPKKAVVDPRNWRWLCGLYLSSGEFKQLDDKTQRVRRHILELTYEEPIAPKSPDKFQNVPVTAMTPAACRTLRDRLASTPAAANERLKAIRQVFLNGIATDELTVNPSRDVPYLKYASSGFYTWSENDIRQFCTTHAPGSKARRALTLLLVLGPRTQDAVILGRQHMSQGWIKFRPLKTRKKTNVEVEVELDPVLQIELELAPKGELLFLQTEHGKPYSVKGFYNWFKRQCVTAGLPQCAPHGLRKAGATIRAENGATDYGLAALYGWASSKTAQVYTRGANRKKLAAGVMGLLTVQLDEPVGQSSEKPNEISTEID